MVESLLRNILVEARYAVREIDLGSEGHCTAFENSICFGCAFVYDSANDLATRWPTCERAFALRYVSRVRMAGTKAWNFYSVHLAMRAHERGDYAKVISIEEDLSTARKIAAVGPFSDDSLRRTLAPLLPLPHFGAFATAPLSASLRERLDDVQQRVLDALLSNEPAKRIVHLFEADS